MKDSNDLKRATTSNKTKYMKRGFICIPIIAAVLIFLILFKNISPVNRKLTLHGSNLMSGITSHKVKAAKADDSFISSTADFSIDLFKYSYTQGKNSLISPFSVYLALGMTANGADSNTLKEFENLLGKQNISINSLNSYYKNLSDRLKNTDEETLDIANSIWYRNDKSLNVKKAFLQTNADYYGASAYKADFNNPRTVTDINNWVKYYTNNKIDKIIDKADANSLMLLINAIYFEDKWKDPFYTQEDIHKGTFELIDGTQKKADFMCSLEKYFKDDKVKGFIKPYKSGKYSFVAILPNEGINIYNYVSSLSGESFIKLIKSKSNNLSPIALPKFKTEYQIDLVGPLKQMGLKDCFNNNADFSKMASKSDGNICIGNVLHKTFISVDHEGTKAGAATNVTLKGFMPSPEIYLNRPFIYAIIDNETYLPIFLGIMMNPIN